MNYDRYIVWEDDNKKIFNNYVEAVQYYKSKLKTAG